jgi:hypothetical protein
MTPFTRVASNSSRNGMADGSTKLSAVLSGIAGEYLVAAELSRRGYLAALTLRNSRGVDILASNANATKSVGIQVRTNQKGRSKWVLNKKAEVLRADNLFYVFVNLNAAAGPEFHVVPCSKVATFARRLHRKWLATPRRDGQPHNNSMRKFADIDGAFRNRWDLLGLDP